MLLNGRSSLLTGDPIVSNHVSRVATGFGQPPSTLYDWTLSSSDSMDINFKLPEDIKSRLEIERFCDKVTKALYTNRRDPVGLCRDQERSTLISFLARDYDELEQLMGHNDSKHVAVSSCGNLTGFRYYQPLSTSIQSPPSPLSFLRRPFGEGLSRTPSLPVRCNNFIPRGRHES